MGGCCSKKQGASKKNLQAPVQPKKDKYGRPMHRARGPIFSQPEIVYTNMKGMAELACKDPAKFIEITK